MNSTLFEDVSCPICHTSDVAELAPSRHPHDITEEKILSLYSSSSEAQRYDPLAQCQGCELVYLKPRVREEIVIRSYREAVDPVFFEQNPGRIRTFSRIFRRVTRGLGLGEPAKVRVLDVGCAGGAFPLAATQLGFQVVGIDPSAWLCAQGSKAYGLDLRAGVLSEQKFHDASFDIVTLWDVLEHLTKPEQELEQIRRILKSRGHLVISVPDYGSWARRILQDKWPFFLNVHLFYFTRRTLTKFLKLHGFTVERTFPLWQTLELGYVLHRASAYFGLFGWLEKAIKSFGLGRIPVTYQVGQTVFVARKD